MSVRDLDRRQVLALGAGAFVVAAIPFAARGKRARLTRRRVPVMGTIADLAVVSDDPHPALDAAVGRLRFVDRTMTRFSDGSDVGRANLAAGGEPVAVDGHTRTVLEAALAWAQATDGVFDPCLGRASEAWEVTQRTTPPSADAVAPLAGRRLYRALDLDGNRVRLTDPRAGIDLGGIAKGYGVDLAVAALREHGIEDALVNVGGDLYAMGTSEDGDDWLVGIRAPDDPAALSATVRVRDAAIATSGDYERGFLFEGRRYHHLLDPATAAPRVCAVHSVTTRAATCMTADAAATAAFGDPGARLPGATVVSG